MYRYMFRYICICIGLPAHGALLGSPHREGHSSAALIPSARPVSCRSKRAARRWSTAVKLVVKKLDSNARCAAGLQ